MDRYDPHQIERRWQAVWESERTWEVPNPGQDGFDDAKPKAYVLEMLPYPSGEPHVGHLKNYSLGDAIAHFRRRHGFQVVHPMGFDSFGLPAENHAIRTGEHPRIAVEESIESYRRQLRSWGVSIDWSRELCTHLPDYYRWTQWIFLRMLERDLAYRAEAPVKWCPNDQTVLANEQVIDGRCERCGAEVVARNLEQWFFRITAYADRLLSDFDLLESWPEHVVTMQRNWIGRSEGAEVIFRGVDFDLDFPVFTTRPDTLFGATFFVLAPEHPEVQRLAAGTEHEDEVRRYVDEAVRASAEERGAEERQKTGVPLGRTITNPVNGEQIPMFVADYVLMEYGTGAIMAVPAHDQRDGDFARAFGLPIRTVVVPGDPDEAAEPFLGEGESETLVESGEFTGMSSPDAKRAITEWLRERGQGDFAVNYRLRDWLLSRQRYWGCPIPVVYCEEDGIVPVPDEQLPVELPEVEDYAPKGRSPLAAVEDWVTTTCPAMRRPGPPRDRHDGHLRRLLVVLHPLPRRSQRRAALGARDRRLLDAGRPVHRRRRARDPAPDVRPLLHQGAGGHGPPRRAGAVREPFHPGDDHPRRRQDVLVEGQHGQRRRDGRALRRRHRPDVRLLHGSSRPRRRLARRGRRGGPPLPFPRLAARDRRSPPARDREATRAAPRATRTTCWRRPSGRSTRRHGTSATGSSSTPRSPR